MKKLVLISLCFPFIAMAQKKDKGYGFIGAGIHFFSQSAKNPVNFAGRVNLGVLPVPSVGFGVDLQFIQNYGVPLLGDFRFIGKHVNGSRPTIAIKAGTNLYNKLATTGGLVYGAEAGVIFGKQSGGFYVTAQYLSIQYNNKLGGFKLNDFGLNFGAKF